MELHIYKWMMCTEERLERNGMGIVIKKTIPSLHLTHKDYKLNERILKILCRFPKERREKTFLEFSRVIYFRFF